MKLATILNENEPLQLTPKLKDSFENIFSRVQSALKTQAHVSVTQKWVSGFLNQIHKFPDLPYILDNARASGNDVVVRDTEARIEARDIFARLGLLDPENKFLPSSDHSKQILSRMRQYYARDPNHEKEQADMGKVTRIAFDADYADWFKSLNSEQRNWVTQLQEMTPEDWANFKGIVGHRDDKKSFMKRLQEWLSENHNARQTLEKLGAVEGGKINGNTIDSLREFFGSLTDSRFQDVISKSMKYSGKKNQHDEYRNTANAALKQMDQKPNSSYNTMIKLYNFIAPRMATQKDKERSFRRVLDASLGKIPAAHGNREAIKSGALYLWKKFQGQHVDPQAAIKDLMDRHHEEPSMRIRTKKAGTRLDTIRKQNDL
jgi:hypothetical protein